MGIGSLQQYGYNPGQYAQAKIASRRRFVSGLTQGLQDIAGGVSRAVGATVEGKKQDTRLLAQANALYNVASGFASAIQQDTGPYGRAAREGAQTGNFQLPERPSPKWSTSELQESIEDLNTGINNLITNVAGSGQLSQSTLTKMSEIASEAGVSVDLSEPLKRVTTRKAGQDISTALSGRGPSQLVAPPGQEGGFTEEEMPFAKRTMGPEGQMVTQPESQGPPQTESEYYQRLSQLNPELAGGMAKEAGAAVQRDVAAKQKAAKEQAVQTRFEAKQRLDARKVQVQEKRAQIASWAVAVQQGKLDTTEFNAVRDETNEAEETVQDYDFELTFLKEELDELQKNAAVTPTTIAMKKREIEKMKRERDDAKQYFDDMKTLRDQAKKQMKGKLPSLQQPRKPTKPSTATKSGKYKVRVIR